MPIFKTCTSEPDELRIHKDWLSPPEFDRFLQLAHPSRRRDWLIGRWTAKSLLREFLVQNGRNKASLADIEIVGETFEDPSILVSGVRRDDLCISISHSDGSAYAGLTSLSEEGRIGVDLEKIRPVHPKLAQRILTERESAEFDQNFRHNKAEGLILYWSLKESAYKCLRSLHPVTKSQFEVQLDLHKDSATLLTCIRGQEVQLSANYEKERAFYKTSAIASPEIVNLLSHH